MWTDLVEQRRLSDIKAGVWTDTWSPSACDIVWSRRTQDLTCLPQDESRPRESRPDSFIGANTGNDYKNIMPEVRLHALLEWGSAPPLFQTTSKVTRNLAIANRSRICLTYEAGTQLQFHWMASLRLTPTNCHVKLGIYKKLGCRREATWRCVKKISLSETTPLSRACISSHQYSISVVTSYLYIMYRFWDIQRRIIACPLNLGYGLLILRIYGMQDTYITEI